MFEIASSNLALVGKARALLVNSLLTLLIDVIELTSTKHRLSVGKFFGRRLSTLVTTWYDDSGIHLRTIFNHLCGLVNLVVDARDVTHFAKRIKTSP